MRVDEIAFFTVIKIDKNSLELENVPMLSAFIEDLWKDGCAASKDIILDFQDVDGISSSGIGLLIHIYRKILKQHEHELYIININDKVLKIFELTKILGFFKIYKDYDELMLCLKEVC